VTPQPSKALLKLAVCPELLGGLASAYRATPRLIRHRLSLPKDIPSCPSLCDTAHPSSPYGFYPFSWPSLSSYTKYFGATHRADTLSGWLTVLHGYPGGVLDLHLGFTLYAICLHRLSPIPPLALSITGRLALFSSLATTFTPSCPWPLTSWPRTVSIRHN